MLFPQSNFDADTVALMGRAFDDAWSLWSAMTSFPSEADESVIKTAMAQMILSAVANGERGYDALKDIALGREVA
jgi:hypothetical protein